jgi:Tol biopolymer transport system component
MKALLICAFVMALFTHCSEEAPVKPQPENGSLRKIVFNAKDEQGRYKLYTISEKGTGLKEIFSPNARICDLWVSPQGDRVVCCVDQLFLVKIDGSEARQLTSNPPGFGEEPQWFPNGDEILYGFFGPWRGAQIFRIQADGSNQTRITTDDSSSHRHPRLSPDAKKIAFETRGTKDLVWVINIDGTNKTLLSTPEYDAWKPEWTIDSKKIVYGNEKGLWIIDADGINRKLLYDSGSLAHVSPVDGKIAFLGYYGVYIIAPDSSGFRKVVTLTMGDYPILWSRDGVKIAFRGDVNGDREEGICTVNADGSDLREITIPTLKLEPSPCRAFDWIP